MACTLIDVMSCVPLESQKFEPGPQEYLNQLLNLISTLRGGESRYLPLVMAKIRDTLPGIVQMLPQHLVMKMSNRTNTLPGIQDYIKQEQHSSGSSSARGSSSPYSTPPFMHYYPLA